MKQVRWSNVSAEFGNELTPIQVRLYIEKSYSGVV